MKIDIPKEWFDKHANDEEGLEIGAGMMPQCGAGSDGECYWEHCPQIRDGGGFQYIDWGCLRTRPVKRKCSSENVVRNHKT